MLAETGGSAPMDRLVRECIALTYGETEVEVARFADALFGAARGNTGVWPKAVPKRLAEAATRTALLSWARTLGPGQDGVGDTVRDALGPQAVLWQGDFGLRLAKRLGELRATSSTS